MGKILYLFMMLVCMPVESANSQDGCPAPSYVLPTNVPNILSEQQENDFGDASAEQVQSDFLVIEDEITENIRRIGQRLLAQAPPSGLHFQFYLVEYPHVNAFSLPGGRIYIPRKLVAACKNKDELAGVLAHEIGHSIMRHSAIDFTRLLKKVLGISSVGNRQDVFAKFNQLLDNIARNPGALKAVSRDENEEQISADRISVYLVKKAGYSPQAYIQLWDRIQELGGKTGGILSDFLQTTRPEQKRLREMQRIAEQLPDACTGPRPSTTAEEFEVWKTAVMEYSGLGHRESLPAAERKQPLQPRLRGDITHILFSGDGKYLLAQDSSSIFVLSHNPFNVLFRIDARSANPAHFTPDSESIVFSTSSLRVETWSVAEQRRSYVQEMAVTYDCLNDRLSPDARHLACFDADNRMTLFNVSDGAKVFQRGFSNSAFSSILGQLLFLLRGRFCRLEFSPDGRYFIGLGLDAGQYVAYDFVENRSVKLPDAVKDRLSGSFGFMSGNRFVGVSDNKGENAAVIGFPSGEVLQTMPVGFASVSPTTHGDFLIIRPVKEYPVGVMDMTQNKFVMGSERDAIDFYDKEFASESTDGVLLLLHMEKKEALGSVELPESPLPQPVAVSLSADRNWLAVSEKSRGAIWDLRTGSRTFFARNFQAAQFAPDNTLIVDFPKSGEAKRMIVRVNPTGPSVVSSARLEADRIIIQEGLYLVEKKEPENRKNQARTVLSVTNAVTGQALWSRDYPKGFPWLNFNSEEDKAIFVWGASSDFVKAESNNDPVLKKKIASKRERQGDYYIQILQASTGNVLHTVYVETGRGSFRFRWAELAGDHLTLYDNHNRLLIYSISSGQRLGQIFGVNGSLSPATPLLAAENKPGVLTIYSLPSMEERGKLMFTRPLVFVKFSSDGKQLFALTNDQMTYLFHTEEILAGKAE
jgi:WD40 repeat protein